MSYRKFAYVYDELMDDMPYPEWLRFVREVWDKYGMPRQVAELGCGTGSITIPLVNAGFRVTGIDLSSDMLSVARDKMESTPQGHRLFQDGHVQWVCQNMTEWMLAEPVDSVISFCDCINYVTEPEDVIRTFQSTYNGLKPGGTFVFDVHHPNTLCRYDAEQPFMLDDRHISYLWTCEYDTQRTEIEHHLTIFAQTGENKNLYERFEEVHVQRSYEQEWLTTELYKTGFRDVKCFADFTWNEPSEEAARLFFVAVK